MLFYKIRIVPKTIEFARMNHPLANRVVNMILVKVGDEKVANLFSIQTPNAHLDHMVFICKC